MLASFALLAVMIAGAQTRGGLDQATDIFDFDKNSDGEQAPLTEQEFNEALKTANRPPEPGMLILVDEQHPALARCSKPGEARVKGSDLHYTWWQYTVYWMKVYDRSYDGLLTRTTYFDKDGKDMGCSTYVKFVYSTKRKGVDFFVAQPPGATHYEVTIVHPGAREVVRSSRREFFYTNPVQSTGQPLEPVSGTAGVVRYDRSDSLPSQFPPTWYVFVPKPPDLPSQHVSDVVISIDGKEVQPETVYDAAWHRPLYRVVVPAASLVAANHLHVHVEYHGTFGGYGAAESLSPSDRQRYLRSEGVDQSGTDLGACDFASEAFQAFLDQSGLRKGLAEPDHTFAARALHYCDTHYAYTHEANCHATFTVRAGRAECGGWAALITSILRASNIPARVLAGVRRDGETHVVSDFYDDEAGRWVQLEVTGDANHPCFDRWNLPMFVSHVGDAFRLEWIKGSFVERDFIQGATEAYHSVGQDGFRAVDSWTMP